MGGELSTCCKSEPKVNESEKASKEDLKSNGTKEHKGPEQVPKQGAIAGPQGTHQALRLLGRGSAADTWLFRDIKLSKPVAIKLFARPIDYYPVSAVVREVLVQTQLGPGHINLINVYELFLTHDYLGIVMEWAEGGSLTTYVGSCWEKAEQNGLVLPEEEVLYYFKQFISAVGYCHRHNIAHRDLKLDNTLLDGSDPPILKICDFGFARQFKSPLERTNSHLGTPEYCAPELLHKSETGEHDSYDARSVDVWASGVLLLVCLCGAFPFDHTAHNMSQPPGDEETDLWLQEVSKNWKESSFISHNINALSGEVRDLLDKILVVDPSQRITVDGIMQHPWYNRKLPSKYQKALDSISEQQADLEKHVKETAYDQAKVAERQEAIRSMVADAGNASSKAIQRRSTLRPLHMLDMKHKDLTSISLTEDAVIQGDSHHERDSSVVRERFGNSGVSDIVDSAFSGDSRKGGMGNAADEVKRQAAGHPRAGGGGGAPVGGGVAS